MGCDSPTRYGKQTGRKDNGCWWNDKMTRHLCDRLIWGLVNVNTE